MGNSDQFELKYKENGLTHYFIYAKIMQN